MREHLRRARSARRPGHVGRVDRLLDVCPVEVDLRLGRERVPGGIAEDVPENGPLSGFERQNNAGPCAREREYAPHRRCGSS